jgi:glucose-6-phosphate 1-dehydrogenase
MKPNPLRDPRDRRIPRLAGPCVLVLFGVTGDLASKKLLPAIYDLANRGLLPPGFSLVGFARRDWADEDFAQVTHDAVKAHARTPFREDVWNQLSEGIRFVQGEFSDDAAFDHLARTVADLDAQRGTGGNYAFYLSVPPAGFPLVVSQLQRSGLSQPVLPSTPGGYQPWRRVVIEKPFGHDLASAQELNAMLDAVFPASSVFRIDHYLGKETVQNLLALRFANTLFEPIWNRGYVDHVQITMAEDIGIGGRAGYYDGIGAARDVIQNHLLQLLALTAMEEPLSFAADSLRSEKEKVLKAVQIPADLATGTARGQYAAGWQGGIPVRGFLEEDGIPPDSATDLRCYPADHRQQALGWRALLPAHGQAAADENDGDRGDVPARTASAVRRHRHPGAGPECAGYPRAARRGRDAAVRLEGSGLGHGSPRREHGLRLRGVVHRVKPGSL